MGDAWSYVQEIYNKFKEIGYQVKHWLCKGEQMGIPQTRHRVFFIALRNDNSYDLKDLDMSFYYEPITYGKIKSGSGRPLGVNTKYYQLLCMAKPEDKAISDIKERIGEKRGCFSDKIVWDCDIVPTLRAATSIYSAETKSAISKETAIHAQTFPEDYNFLDKNPFYICGMSVPPVMIKRIVQRLIESGVFK